MAKQADSMQVNGRDEQSNMVDGPWSIRRMAPHIKSETARAVFPYAWQTAAAIYSAYGRKGDVREEKECKLTPAELGALAIKKAGGRRSRRQRGQK